MSLLDANSYSLDDLITNHLDIELQREKRPKSSDHDSTKTVTLNEIQFDTIQLKLANNLLIIN